MAQQRFYPLTVKAIDKVTEDCSVISFNVEKDLQELFSYKQGQYLTLKAMIAGEEVRRSYSLCSSPLDEEWKVGIKRIAGGKFSTYANKDLKAGDTVEVMPPNGRFFTEIETDRAKNYVAFAAGSGITPIFSIIKTHLLAEPLSHFTLFYINQQVSSIILKEEIEALKNLFLDRFKVFHFLTQEQRSAPLFNGRLNTEKLDVISEKMLPFADIDDFFVCGPEEMIFMIRDYLLTKQVDGKKIHFELFTSGVQKNGAVKTTDAQNATAEQINCAITIVEGGKAFQVSLQDPNTSILDAALSQGADLPFACKGGVCCTCRAKIIEGEVEMQVNYALEEEEVQAGYVLTCQSMPKSNKVVVDFDV
ncbi:MAG: phenylacetate-CoA oxygenase/reductase subunit PaaK [Saprospiraceae bacterium]|nr:phenylacetate-CoA oxygenase/reductase subunit PaaK [Saprospiraceae bacterium]